MYKFFTLMFKLKKASLFINKSIGKNFFCGKGILFKVKGKIRLFNHVVIRNYCNILVEKNGSLTIGENSFFNNYCSVNCLGKIKIGDNCLFGEGVKIYDHNHNYSSNKLIKDAPLKIKDITIGNNCWFGSNSVILAGIKIGDNCVIGANSVIYKSIPSNTIVLSNGTQKKIGEINKCQ